MMIKLQARDIVFGYNSNPILNNVNFQIAPSKLVTIVGPNGSGKTTTVLMLTTLLEPSAGTAEIYGYDIRQDPRKVREFC